VLGSMEASGSSCLLIRSGKTGFIGMPTRWLSGKYTVMYCVKIRKRWGYQTEKFKGMGNVIDALSKRNHAIDVMHPPSAGGNASLKSRGMATLDTRKAKVASDPAALPVEWL
jgi:hypothetical protein